ENTFRGTACFTPSAVPRRRSCSPARPPPVTFRPSKRLERRFSSTRACRRTAISPARPAMIRRPASQARSRTSTPPGRSSKGRFRNRKPPSAAYAIFSPVLHHIDDDGVTIVGGAFLDGWATGKKLGSAIADQAQGPFLNPDEMALPHAACVVAKVLNPADPAA